MTYPTLTLFKNSVKAAVHSMSKMSMPNDLSHVMEKLNHFLKTDGQPEEVVSESLVGLFNGMAENAQKQNNHATWDKLVKLLELIASSDEEMKKKVADIKELLKKDNLQKKLGYDKMVALLKDVEFARFCATQLCKIIKSKPEKIAAELKTLNSQFEELYSLRASQASYGEWSAVGVQLYDLVIAAIRIKAAEAGFDLPESKVSSEPHGGPSTMMTPDGKVMMRPRPM
jgi:hypothetical protein